MTKTNMAVISEVVNEYILDDNIVNLWPNYPCLFDSRSPDLKNRDKRQKAHKEIAKKLDQTGRL